MPEHIMPATWLWASRRACWKICTACCCFFTAGCCFCRNGCFIKNCNRARCATAPAMFLVGTQPDSRRAAAHARCTQRHLLSRTHSWTSGPVIKGQRCYNIGKDGVKLDTIRLSLVNQGWHILAYGGACRAVVPGGVSPLQPPDLQTPRVFYQGDHRPSTLFFRAI